jgi:chemotaxis protein MotB
MRVSSAGQKSRNRENEAWIYSYADLITNLLALFMMLLVISSGQVKAASQKSQTEQIISATDSARIEELVININQLQTPADQSSNSDERQDNQAEVLKDNDGLKVSFGGEMLFPSGSSDIREESMPVLARISSLLQTLPKNIVIDVEGHSDSTPTRSGRYPSNWELSSARAGSVVRALQDFGFPADRMRAIGLADTKPAAEGRDNPANRRVVLRVRLKEGG